MMHPTLLLLLITVAYLLLLILYRKEYLQTEMNPDSKDNIGCTVKYRKVLENHEMTTNAIVITQEQGIGRENSSQNFFNIA